MIFIDLTLEDQAGELKSYFKKLGADITEERSNKGLEDDLRKIINVCDVCFKEANENEIETVLNDIVSILVVMPPSDNTNRLIASFVDKLYKTALPKLGPVCLRVLWVLFQSLDKSNPIRYDIYYHLILIAKRIDMVKSIFRDVKQLKEQFAKAPLSNEQMQRLLRSLHEGLVAGRHSDVAAKVMIELLSTYTEENASQAKEDAQRCIVTALADPNTFLLDPLLSLKPIKALKGELIHDLLTIFVSNKLSVYTKFYKGHKEFVNNLGLDHDQNTKKMRLLTFMQLAENSNELSFETIQKELSINENDVEAFIIEALKTKLVRARMDQTAKKVHISSTMHRTFGMPQWQQLRDVLQAWKLNLNSIDESMKMLVSPQK
ncbi:eukaryotic translation initiation factor 3 subunit M [Planococcus citri]|uniref:eukaryotic translation initiation factor 3 subunit M n=1 Tax=Planococcus citri TaxID=170843 RepID=UPI0031FA4351